MTPSTLIGMSCALHDGQDKWEPDPVLELLNPAGRRQPGPLVNVTAANHFWHLLPRSDPVAAQRALSEALDELATRSHLNVDHLRALLGIDQLARSLADALLVDYAMEEAQPHESDAWQAAFDLSRSFARAFKCALRYLRDDKPSRVRPEYTITVLLRLFQHRQVDFLLRPFVDERSLPDGWIELHAAYLYAESQGLLHRPLVSRRNDDARGDESTLEREYIHLLLTDLLSVGQLSPYDAFWVSRQMPRWRGVLSLQSAGARVAGARVKHRFVVDLGTAKGLVRPTGPSTDAHRYLDPSPMLALIKDEVASLVDSAGSLDYSSPIRRGRQVKLLRKVYANCLPNPERISRRGDRLPVVSTLTAFVGLPHITRMLRHQKRKGTDPASSSTDEFGAPHQEWQLKDSSASGCRLHGKLANPNRVLPGTLLAFRLGANMPWTLAIVRRFRKRIGDRVDIGVEYVGRNPLGVTLVSEPHPTGQSDAAPERTRKQCTALYLRESSEHPKLPFKTLILWPRDFKVGRSLILSSDDATYTVRLKEPIEEQDGFVWLPYEVVDRRAGGGDMLQEVA